MDTEQYDMRAPGTASAVRQDAGRWRRLAESLGAQIDAAREAERSAYAKRDEARARAEALAQRYLESQSAARATERERRLFASELGAARAYIARLQPLMREARTLLASMQLSKFWKARNAWFAFKQQAGLSGAGPQPFWVPDVDVQDERWERDAAYEAWLTANAVGAASRRRMVAAIELFALRPTFSVVMPVYNTPDEYLRMAIESVQRQIYPDWELCIADDASTDSRVRTTLEEFAAGDRRIKLVFRPENGHIAATSNSALELATGEFVALLDHDDALAPEALFENALAVNRRPDVDIIYSDEDKMDARGKRRDPYFKPDWAPDSLLARNYISHLGVYRRSLLRAIGGFRVGFEGSQDYDLILRASERTDRIEHIPHVLYHWRIHGDSTAAARDQKAYAFDAAVRALEEAVERRREPATVLTDDRIPGIYTIRYVLQRPGRVSVIVPTRDHGSDLDRCLTSVFGRSTYDDLEVVLLDNGTTDDASLRTLGKWVTREPGRLKLVPYDVPFNFSKINNYAVRHASGDYLLFLNNDTEVITPDWIEAMMEQAQRPAIGAVGAKLLYADGTVQHAGVIIGIGGVAGHSHKYIDNEQPGYFATLQTVNNFSAVTAACLMTRRDVFESVGGFDEELAIAFNDVDFCLRLRRAGYRNVYVPHAVLYHYESKSRGHENTPEKTARFLQEQYVMRGRWQTDQAPDPYYNPNLTLQDEDYGIRL